MKEAINRESSLLKSILKRFHETTGLSITVEAQEVLLAPQKRFDALLTIRMGQIEVPFVAEVKQSIDHPEAIRSFLANIRRPFIPIVIANDISLKMKEHLRQREVAFLCGDGDFFLPITNLQDRKPPEMREPIQEGLNIHSIHGMGYIKLGLVIARSRKAREMNVSQLSEALNISMGTVSNILTDWDRMGFLEKTSEARKFKDLENFCRRWATAYEQVKYHKAIFLGVYDSLIEPAESVWGTEYLASIGCLWGGEQAAALLTHHLQPEKLTLYTTSNLRQIIGKLRLKPNPNGKIAIFRSFWAEFADLLPKMNLPSVDPMIVFADLINSSSSRNREVAEIIFKKFIAGYL